MSELFDPRLDILPAAQQEIWPQLAQARSLGFVLYGGTAVALHLGHRTSIDFDFFKAESLEKALGAFAKMYRSDAAIPLRALGFFKDGDLPSLPKSDQDLLRVSRDRVSTVPEIDLRSGLLPADA